MKVIVNNEASTAALPALDPARKCSEALLNRIADRDGYWGIYEVALAKELRQTRARITLLEGLLEERCQNPESSVNLSYRLRHALDKPEGCNCQACTAN